MENCWRSKEKEQTALGKKKKNEANTSANVSVNLMPGNDQTAYEKS